MMSCMAAVRGGVVLTALALVGCASSPQVHYYTLLPASSRAPEVASADYRIELLPVRVPQQVDHPQLVIRQGEGRLALVETRQWAAPLGAEMRDALSARLTGVLGALDVAGLRDDLQWGTVYRIKAQVGRFDSVLGAQVRLDAVWDLSEGSGPIVASCNASIAMPAQGGYEALLLAQQGAVAALGDQVAASIRAQTRGGGCGG